MIPYRIAPLAQNDLDEIWTYVAGDSLGAADRLIDMFQQKFLLLASQPVLGESREEIQPNLRAFVMGSYVALYRPWRSGIEVVRVIHSSRDLGAQFRPPAF